MGKIAGTVSGAVQAATTTFVFFGEFALERLGIARTPFLNQLFDNRMQLLMASFLLNTMAQNLENTGAFEIYVNDRLEFSKLKSGRMPAIQEITHILETRLGLQPPRDEAKFGNGRTGETGAAAASSASGGRRAAR